MKKIIDFLNLKKFYFDLHYEKALDSIIRLQCHVKLEVIIILFFRAS